MVTLCSNSVKIDIFTEVVNILYCPEQVPIPLQVYPPSLTRDSCFGADLFR